MDNDAEGQPTRLRDQMIGARLVMLDIKGVCLNTSSWARDYFLPVRMRPPAETPVEFFQIIAEYHPALPATQDRPFKGDLHYIFKIDESYAGHVAATGDGFWVKTDVANGYAFEDGNRYWVMRFFSTEKMKSADADVKRVSLHFRSISIAMLLELLFKYDCIAIDADTGLDDELAMLAIDVPVPALLQRIAETANLQMQPRGDVFHVGRHVADSP